MTLEHSQFTPPLPSLNGTWKIVNWPPPFLWQLGKITLLWSWVYIHSLTFTYLIQQYLLLSYHCLLKKCENATNWVETETQKWTWDKRILTPPSIKICPSFEEVKKGDIFYPPPSCMFQCHLLGNFFLFLKASLTMFMYQIKPLRWGKVYLHTIGRIMQYLEERSHYI